MATYQYAGTALAATDQTTTAPLVVLFERDDAIAVPLLAQIRLAQYDVRAARTPVELFDILGKHDVALVLVDLGNATAGRREFWVALDGQRRGHPTQVMTFRYTPPGGIFDTDFEPSARAIADVEIGGAAEFELILDGIRQRVPLSGGRPGTQGYAPLSPPAIRPFGAALPDQGLGAAALGGGPQQNFAVPRGYYSPPPTSDPFGASPPYPHPNFVVPSPHAADAGSPFAHPATVNPFAPGSEPSPFAHPANVNPFADDVAPQSVTPHAPVPPLFGGQHPPVAPAGPAGRMAQPHGAPAGFEERAAHLSEMYAAQFGLNGNPGAPRPSPSVAEWGTPAPAGSPSSVFGASGPGFAPSAPDFGASDSSLRRAKEPIADTWTPPDGAVGLDPGDETGVVPEMAYRPFSDSAERMPRTGPADRWVAGPPAQAPIGAIASDRTVPVSPVSPASPERLPAIRTQPAETALGAVLVEGALLSPERLAALKGIQRLLANVNMDFRLGELALMFQFLSPDQLLAAMLVSRGLVSPQQIAGLGRVKQEMASQGMEHDLESLLTMFHILPAEQIRVLRAELGG
ncbi:MAG TPA: hypothetical protein VF116_00900 [Ktedonobacterales bacterium]